jgi:hypothetical protein
MPPFEPVDDWALHGRRDLDFIDQAQQYPLWGPPAEVKRNMGFFGLIHHVNQNNGSSFQGRSLAHARAGEAVSADFGVGNGFKSSKYQEYSSD